jgi:hypothetical protein
LGAFDFCASHPAQQYEQNVQNQRKSYSQTRSLQNFNPEADKVKTALETLIQVKPLAEKDNRAHIKESYL